MYKKCVFFLCLVLLCGCGKDENTASILPSISTTIIDEIEQEPEIEIEEEKECVHEWSYEKLNDDTHIKTCTICGLQEKEDCKFDYEDDLAVGNACICGNLDYEPIKLSIVGDCMLADYKNTDYAGFNKCVEENGYDYFLENVGKYFNNDDFTIVNLENVLTDRNLPMRFKDENPGWWYWSKASNVNILTNYSVDLANCCNNHIRDLGDEGIKDTYAALESVGIKHNKSEITYLEKDGYTISVICCGLWVWGQESGIKDLVAEAKNNSDFLIVYFHGGEMKVHKPDENSGLCL